MRSLERPWLLCKNGGEWTWDNDPLIVDLPGVEAFDGIPLLPPGSWRGLRSGYALKRASEVVQIQVVTEKPVRSTGLLDIESRAQLLAVLIKRGADPEQTTRRLALIRPLPVARLTIAFSLNGARSEVQRSFYLDVARTPRRITSARLYYTPGEPINMTTLGREIGALLDEHDLASIIALVLREADEVLADEVVLEDELNEARRRLQTARRRARIPEDDDYELLELIGDDEPSEQLQPPEATPAPSDADGRPEHGPTEPASRPPAETHEPAVATSQSASRSDEGYVAKSIFF
jgi:hypothetical protein